MPHGFVYPPRDASVYPPRNGSKFTATTIRACLQRLGVALLYTATDSSWENGYIEPFNGKLRDEVLNRVVFHTLIEGKVLVE